MLHKGKIGLLSLAAMCVGVASYSGINSDFITDLIGDDSEFSQVLKDMPSDAIGVVKKVYSILGNPRDNFQQSMTEFENAAHKNNPYSHGHGDYSRIYNMLDINQMVNQLRELKFKEYKGEPDSVILRKSLMPSVRK